MSARRWRWRLGISLMALSVSALMAVGALEAIYRQQELSNGLWFPHDEPGRKWALLPEDESINAQGFNERELPFEKPEGVWRVVVVGDSVTFAGAVAREQAYTRVAEQQLQARGLDVQIVNLSVYGYDAEQVAATLRYRAWAYQPDLVVYAAYTNDGTPSRLIHAGEARAPVYVGNEPDETLGALGDWLQRRSAIYRRWRGARYARVIQQDLVEDTERSIAFVVEHLEDMKADAEAHDTPLLIWALAPHVMSPQGCQLPQLDGLFCAHQLRWIQRLEEEALARGLPVAHSLGVWTRSGREGFFNPDTPGDIHHPGAEGHALLGAAFAEALEGHYRGVRPLPRSRLPELELSEPPPPTRPKPARPPKKQRRAPAP